MGGGGGWGEREGGFVLLALLPFPPSVNSSFFIQNGGKIMQGSPGPSCRSPSRDPRRTL